MAKGVDEGLAMIRFFFRPFSDNFFPGEQLLPDEHMIQILQRLLNLMLVRQAIAVALFQFVSFAFNLLRMPIIGLDIILSIHIFDSVLIILMELP